MHKIHKIPEFIPSFPYMTTIKNQGFIPEEVCVPLEKQNGEWKSKWEDKYLKQICGFANSEGGVMKVGVADDGTVVGVADPKGDMKKITDTIANKLSIYPAVHRRDHQRHHHHSPEIPGPGRPRWQVLHPYREHHPAGNRQGARPDGIQEAQHLLVRHATRRSRHLMSRQQRHCVLPQEGHRVLKPMSSTSLPRTRNRACRQAAVGATP